MRESPEFNVAFVGSGIWIIYWLGVVELITGDKPLPIWAIFPFGSTKARLRVYWVIVPVVFNHRLTLQFPAGYAVVAVNGGVAQTVAFTPSTRRAHVAP